MSDDNISNMFVEGKKAMIGKVMEEPPMESNEEQKNGRTFSKVTI